jgi:hypothetical protein
MYFLHIQTYLFNFLYIFLDEAIARERPKRLNKKTKIEYYFF